VADVFISYSRRDAEYVQALATALEQRGKRVWVDTEGIRDGEVFPDALLRAIESSDAFVFVISPDSVTSSFCATEVAHAESLNKRIVPLAHRPVDDSAIPEAVRVRNWIPAGEQSDLGDVAGRLVIALDTDLEWEHAHSRLTVRALEWEQADRDGSFLLRGSDLQAGERWLVEGAVKEPGPTVLESEYLAASRMASARRQRTLVAVSLVVAVLAVALLVFAVLSRDSAITARNAARAQALTSDAERVGAEAVDQQDVDRQLLLAVTGVRLQDRPETRSDLLTVLQNNPALTHVSRPLDDLIDAVAISPDGSTLAVVDSAGELRFIVLADWHPLGAPVQIGGPVAPRAMSFTPDGASLVVLTAQGNESRLLSIQVGSHRVRQLGVWHRVAPIPPIGSDSLAVSPGGRRIAVSLITETASAPVPTAASLLMIDSATGQVVWQRTYPLVPGQSEPHVEFVRADGLLSSAQQGDTLLWSASTGRILRRYPVGGLPAAAPGGQMVALGANSPSLYSGGSSAMIELNLRTGRHRRLLDDLQTGWLRGVFYTPDGRRIVADAFDGIHVWNAETGRIEESYESQPSTRSVMALSADGATAVVGLQDGSVEEFDVSGAHRLGALIRWAPDPDSCTGAYGGPCYAVSSSDVLAASGANGGAYVVDLRTMKRIAAVPAIAGADAGALAFSLGGGELAIGGPDGVGIWDLHTRRQTRHFRFGAPVIWNAISPDGTLLAVQIQAATGQSSLVEVVRINDGEVLQRYTVAHGGGGLDFTPDGGELVALGCCSSGSSVIGWSTRTGARLFDRTAGGLAEAIGISPDSHTLAVGTEQGAVLFLDARTGRQTQPPIQAIAGNIYYVAYSPDGADLSVSGADGTVNLWDVRARLPLGHPFGPYPGIIPTTLFASDGRLLVILLSSAYIWPTDVATWERFACAAAGRQLTPVEWRDLLPTRPYERVCPAS
jgi:WD40 repeat protein